MIERIKEYIREVGTVRILIIVFVLFSLLQRGGGRIGGMEITPWTLLVIPGALLAIVLHELCHALAAYKLGDPTARDMGRLTFNPIKHLDPIGLVLLIVVCFGWAKPVPVDMRYFKSPKRDMALVAIAGPLSNFVLAAIAIICVRLSLMFDGTAAVVCFHFFSFVTILSTGLGIFNLFPIPPMDGSKILAAILPDRWYYKYMGIERYGMILLMILIFTGVLGGPLWLILRNGLIWGYGLVGLIPPQFFEAYLSAQLNEAVSPPELFEWMKKTVTVVAGNTR